MAHRNILLVTEKTHLISWEDITVCGQILHTTLKVFNFHVVLETCTNSSSLGVTAPNSPFTPGHFGLYLPHLLYLQPLVLFYFLLLLFPDVAISWYRYIYNNWGLLFLVSYYFVWLVSQQLCLSQTLDRISRRKWMDNHRMKKLEWWQL